MEKEFDVVELENGIKLTVIDAISYQDRTFILVGKLNETEDDIADELQVFEKIDAKIVEIEDNELLERLIQTFENRIGQTFNES